MTRGLRRRLLLRMLWWRHCWWFACAHKPLCTRFAGGVWRIGRLRICAGCSCVAAGALLLGGSVAAADAALWAPAFWSLTALALPLSWPSCYRRLPRPVQLFARAVLGGSLATLPLLGMIAAWDQLTGAVIVLAGARLSVQRQRRQATRSACQGCPELGGLCPGFRAQADALRGVERDYERIVLGLPAEARRA